MSKVGCQHSAFDVVLSFQFGPCSKQSPEYGSNPGSFADDRIYLVVSIPHSIRSM